MKNITLQKIKQLTGANTVSVRGGVYIIRKSFFYRMGKTTKDLEDKVIKNIIGSFILESGEHNAPFIGGQSIANGSHWFVKFGIDD